MRNGVAQLDVLLDDAGRGDLEAAMTLRRLAGLTEALEALQRRRRGGASGAASQRELEVERRQLAEQMCICVLEDEAEAEEPPAE